MYSEKNSHRCCGQKLRYWVYVVKGKEEIVSCVSWSGMNYFCKFTPCEAFNKEITYVNQRLIRCLIRCLIRSRKKVKRRYSKVLIILKRIALSNLKLFTSGKLAIYRCNNDLSPMIGDYHVWFCERFGVKSPLPTRPKWNYNEKKLYSQLA